LGINVSFHKATKTWIAVGFTVNLCSVDTLKVSVLAQQKYCHNSIIGQYYTTGIRCFLENVSMTSRAVVTGKFYFCYLLIPLTAFIRHKIMAIHKSMVFTSMVRARPKVVPKSQTYNFYRRAIYYKVF